MALKWFSRAPQAPDEAVRLAAEERLLAWAGTDDDRLLAATPTGLWWPDRAGGHELLPWWRIDKVVWRDGVLTVTAADADDELLVERRPQSIALHPGPNPLPALIRKRVEGSIRRAEHVVLPAGAVRVVARAVAGRDGLIWRARLEPGARDSAALREQLRPLLAELAQQSDAALKS